MKYYMCYIANNFTIEYGFLAVIML